MRETSRGATRAVLAVVCALSGACAGSAKYASRAMPAAMTAAAMPAPRPLSRSHFSRDPQGQLGENDLQRIIDAPIALDLPARVGVLPIVTAADWRGPGPNYDEVPAGLAELVKGLRGAEPFTLVTEVMPIPSGALGMEALRNVAARYQLRYILLYRQVTAKQTRLNPWAAGYLTILGALFLPGQTLRMRGYLEASLFDVKTGLLLFTVRRAVEGERKSNVWYRGDKLEAMREKAAQKFAPELAKDVRKAIYRFAEAAKVENQRRTATAAAAAASGVQPLVTMPATWRGAKIAGGGAGAGAKAP